MISRILSMISFGQVQLLQNEMAVIFPLIGWDIMFCNYQLLHPHEVIVRDWFSCPATTNPAVGTALCSHPRKYSGACHSNVLSVFKMTSIFFNVFRLFNFCNLFWLHKLSSKHFCKWNLCSGRDLLWMGITEVQYWWERGDWPPNAGHALAIIWKFSWSKYMKVLKAELFII